MNYYISKYCIIRRNRIILDGKNILNSEKSDFKTFIKSAYKNLKMSYPKFFKMDEYCKLALIASEYVTDQGSLLSKYNDEDIGIVLCNSSATLNTDKEFYRTIADRKNYFPSPAVFVYTLSNIMIGEICIKNKIKGEGSFFIFENFDADFLSEYIASMMDDNNMECCITGWVDYQKDNYDAVLFLIEKESNNYIFTPENLNNIYYEKEISNHG